MVVCSSFFLRICRVVVLQRGLGGEIRGRLAGGISGSSRVIHWDVAELSVTPPVVERDDEREFVGNTGHSSELAGHSSSSRMFISSSSSW